jgi:hypothetical protein
MDRLTVGAEQVFVVMGRGEQIAPHAIETDEVKMPQLESSGRDFPDHQPLRLTQ